MNSTINRRAWLKKSVLATGAVTMGSKVALASAPYHPTLTPASHDLFWEWEHTRTKLPPLKARLLANENPYGPGPLTTKAILESVSKGNRYGHEDAAILKEMIAQKEGVTTDHIMLGPGSSDLLEKVAISQFIEGGQILSADPAYMSLIKTAKAMSAEWKSIPLTDTYAHDLSMMASSINLKTNLIYICNPNNPTGTITPAKELWDFCSEASNRALTFVDEAYLEFMDPTKDKMSMVGLIKEGKNVIVSRTFSKVYGMAGLRVGYIVGLPETLNKMSKIWRGNMGMNITALKGAIAALKDENFVKETVAKNTECREYLFSELSSMGFDYLPSQTSFVLFPIDMKGDDFLDQMLAHGVGVRSFEILGSTHCRVSIGTMAEMELFTGTLKKVMA